MNQEITRFSLFTFLVLFCMLILQQNDDSFSSMMFFNDFSLNVRNEKSFLRWTIVRNKHSSANVCLIILTLSKYSPSLWEKMFLSFKDAFGTEFISLLAEFYKLLSRKRWAKCSYL